MEVGRRSVGSNNEIHERRSRKKKAALPLGVFLSFNDRDVHPECPNASNSYHKCGRHCFDKIPSRKNLLDALRSEGGQEREKKSEKRGINPNCPNASNPYHECAEYCFENLPEKWQDVGKDQQAMKPKEKKKAGFTSDRLVKPECKNASDPYHVCDEYCLENAQVMVQPRQVMRLQSSLEIKNVVSIKERTGPSSLCKHASNPYHDCTVLCCQSVSDRNLAEGATKQKEVKKAVHTIDRLVKPECKHLSNPYHVCDEYCSENAPLRDQPGKAMWVKSLKEVKKLISIKKRTGSPPLCKHASNPYHECTDLCFQSGPVRNLADGDVDYQREIPVTTDKTSVHHDPKHLSGPRHKVTEYCFEHNTLEKKQPEGVTQPEEESKIEEEHVVKLECKNEKVIRHKSLKKGEKAHCNRDKCLEPGTQDASNPRLECNELCFDDIPRRKSSKGAFMKSKESNKEAVPLERGMNSQCKNASNPYHVCTEYCFQNVPDGYHLSRALTKSKEEKKVASSEQIVNRECKNASNPYHICAEYCIENGRERDHPAKTNMNSKEKERAVLPAETVNPDCKFASNPYHVCAEYCFNNFPEREQRRQAMRLNSLKHLKKLVSSKKITSGHSQCIYASNPYHECAEYCLTNSNTSDRVMKTNERKKEDNKSGRRDVNPNCEYLSNPSHRCTENCSEGIRTSQKNEEVEGIKALSREKKGNSIKENKINNLTMKKKSSTSSETRRIFLRDGTDSNDGTEDLQSTAKVVEVKNPREPIEVQPIEVQPLHLVMVSDIFHEWAKYCSQKAAVDDETTVQGKIVGLGELSTRNGKRNAFQTTGGIPLSLLLFFLGLLFAVVYWTRVIQALVMSSGKKNEEP